MTKHNNGLKQALALLDTVHHRILPENIMHGLHVCVQFECHIQKRRPPRELITEKQ